MSKGPLRELARLFDLGQLLAIGVELRQQLFRGLAEIHGDARGRNRLEMQLRQLRVMPILLLFNLRSSILEPRRPRCWRSQTYTTC